MASSTNRNVPFSLDLGPLSKVALNKNLFTLWKTLKEGIRGERESDFIDNFIFFVHIK
jgi:hypothetical protein